MLLRTLHSVLERSPAALLREVLLVDDSSDDLALSEAVRAHIESRGIQDKVSSQAGGTLRAGGYRTRSVARPGHIESRGIHDKVSSQAGAH